MKKMNSVSEFTSERNRTLIDNFRKNLATQSRISIEQAIKGAADTPAPRFWVSEQRAAVVIARMLKADGLYPSPIYPSSIYKEPVKQKEPSTKEPVTKEPSIAPDEAIPSEAILSEMYEEKREMYREIYTRVKTLLVENPGIPVCDAVFEVVNHSAPRSYMSWQRAKSIIYAEARRHRLERSLK